MARRRTSARPHYLACPSEKKESHTSGLFPFCNMNRTVSLTAACATVRAMS